MENRNKKLSVMIDGKLVDYGELSIDELEKIEEELKNKQEELRKKLDAILDE